MSNVIVGVGGIGSWLAPALNRLFPDEPLILFDGDVLEEKNLDRQFYRMEDLGLNKAEALIKRHALTNTQGEPRYYAAGLIPHGTEDILFCCADNNAARLAVLASADIDGCHAIIAANEYRSAEAYYYHRKWRATALDPRVYYPEILRDDGNDPRRPCTGQAAKTTPQLVSSNFMAAALAQQLALIWWLDQYELERETHQYLPYKLIANQSRLETHRVLDARKEENGKEETDQDHDQVVSGDQ